MSKKRGTTNYSFLCAINKPSGLSSHDVVNFVRKVTGERRVGHAGTLDPLASGLLLVCVGPATRLNPYVVGHDKTYQMEISFGCATTTDDSEGAVIACTPVPKRLFDESFACEELNKLVGKGKQIPPAYSAIKVQGKKAYEAAREGRVIELEPRDFEIYSTQLLGVNRQISSDGTFYPVWRVQMHVSKGTYMRSIARDLGHSLGSLAYMSALRRLSVGNVTLDQSFTLDGFESCFISSCTASYLDPLLVLGYRYAFVEEDSAYKNGAPYDRTAIQLNKPIEFDVYGAECCTTGVLPSKEEPREKEVVGLVCNNELKALYSYDVLKQRYNAQCVFPLGVCRGSGI